MFSKRTEDSLNAEVAGVAFSVIDALATEPLVAEKRALEGVGPIAFGVWHQSSLTRCKWVLVSWQRHLSARATNACVHNDPLRAPGSAVSWRGVLEKPFE